MGLVVSNFSNEILIIAVIGAANKTPIIPHIIPQNINDNIIVIGWRPNVSPKILGSTILPITIWTIAGSIITNTTNEVSVNCRKAIGNGINTAITEPKIGIKFRMKVREPKIRANSNPKNQ